MAYRLFVPIYLAAWTVSHAVDRSDTEGAHWLIYITNWSSVFLVLTTITASLITIVYFSTRLLRKYTSCNERGNVIKLPYQQSSKFHWTLKIFWLMYITSQTATVMVCLGYWTTQYNSCTTEDSLAADSNGSGTLTANKTSEENCGADIFAIHSHGINTVVVIADIALCLIPFNLLHFLYPCAFTAAFIIFSGIYHAVNGANESGEPYIYSLLNYGDRPIVSSIAAVILVFIPAIVYLIPFLVAFVRDWIYWMITNSHSTCPNICACGERKRDDGNKRESVRRLSLECQNETCGNQHV